jgi:hypothetical protein
MIAAGSRISPFRLKIETPKTRDGVLLFDGFATAEYDVFSLMPNQIPLPLAGGVRGRGYFSCPPI